MSRIGKRPVQLPKNVDVKYSDKLFEVKGPKGILNFKVPELVDLDIENNVLSVKADYENDRKASCMMGTTQSILSNMVKGVTEGFRKQLNFVGVGYRASINGKTIEFNLGYSHPIKFDIPEGIDAKIEGGSVVLESCDKQLLGQMAADIRILRPPEPYKGKGILYSDEVVRRKVGKSGKK